MRPISIAFSIPLLWCAAVSAQPDVSNAPVKIYTAGADVASPQLLPSSSPHAYALGDCRLNEDGSATFSLIVDSSGQPRNIYFINPIGDDLDLIALREVITDRFTPGKRAGQSVAVAVSLEIKLHACLAEHKDAHGKTQNVLELTSAPVQELKPPVAPPQQVALVSGAGLSTNAADPDAGIENAGGDVKPAVQFKATPSALSEQRAALGQGDYKVSVVVDRYGLPQRLKILEAEIPHREQALASMLRLYRWKPAMKNGEPVPSRVQVEIGNH